MTACKRYLVRPADSGGWMAELGPDECGPYHTRDLALQLAIKVALEARRRNESVRIAVVDARGAPCAERCLCKCFTAMEAAGAAT